MNQKKEIETSQCYKLFDYLLFYNLLSVLVLPFITFQVKLSSTQQVAVVVLWS